MNFALADPEEQAANSLSSLKTIGLKMKISGACECPKLTEYCSSIPAYKRPLSGKLTHRRTI